MPYIERLNQIFVHIPKNAGKSVESALLGPQIHDRSWQNRRPLNRFAKWLLNATSHPRPWEVLHGTVDLSFATQHLSVVEMETLRPDLFHRKDRPRMFAVVRNPWQRALSTYKHFADTDGKPVSPEGFYQFWDKEIDAFHSSKDHNRIAHAREQMTYLYDSHGRFACDAILRFENLEADFAAYCRNHQVVANLPHIGPSKTTNHRDFFNASMLELLGNIFAHDIDFLGYPGPDAELAPEQSKIPKSCFMM